MLGFGIRNPRDKNKKADKNHAHPGWVLVGLRSAGHALLRSALRLVHHTIRRRTERRRGR
jgi:hypothetical protein